MSDDTDNLNRPLGENDTDEAPALPEPGAAENALASSLRENLPGENQTVEDPGCRNYIGPDAVVEAPLK